jgi:MYXO-CTERM domain-containing protein
MHHLIRARFVLCLGLVSSGLSAATVWSEGTDGELSNDYANPTLISLGVGQNLITGTMGENGQSGCYKATGPNGEIELQSNLDGDYFTFEVPTGYTLDFAVSSYSFSGTNAASGFIGLASGSSLTVPTDDYPTIEFHTLFKATGFNSWKTYPAFDDVGALVLEAGTYVVWLQETRLGTITSYSLNFQTTAIPEPASAVWWLGAVAAGVAGMRRRRSAR